MAARRSERGLITAVYEVPLASTLAADHAIGAATLQIVSAVDFVETGGQAILGAAEIVTYTGLVDNDDPTPDTLAVPAGLVNAWPDGTPVAVYPDGVVHLAEIKIDGVSDGGDAVLARVPIALYRILPTGTKEESEQVWVRIEHDGQEWVVVDVIGVAPGTPGTDEPVVSTTIGASVFLTANQPIHTGVFATVPWDSSASPNGWDNGGYHNGPLDQFIVQRPGRHWILGQAAWAANNVGRRKASIIHNGFQVAAYETVALNGFFTTHNLAVLRDCNVGDVFAFGLDQSSGGDLDVIAGFDNSHFQIHLVGNAG